MADAAREATPKPGEVKVDVGALNGSEQEAGDALAALFTEENTEIQQSGDAPAADAEQVETPAIGESEDGHSEQPGTAAIEPPVSWTAEEKQVFAKLPPEAQQAIARRESERERLISTQSQKAIDEAKQFETARQTLANERAQQIQLLQGIVLQLTPELQRFQNIDWQKLAAEKPAEWAAQRQAFDDVMGRINAANAHAMNIAQQTQADREKQHREYLSAEQQKLIQKIPDVADPIKGRAFVEDLTKHLTEFTPDELKSVADHRILLVARDAMLYRKAMAARAAAQTKRAPAAPSNVRPLRPAARNPNAGEDANQRQVAALHDNLRKSGSYRDAADLMVAAGIFGKS